MTSKEYEFDVVFTFAGENRDFVEKVAYILEQNGVKVFYDKNLEVELWGKDLIQYLDEIYRNKAKYCLMFISRDYAEKAWPSHERRSAFARALNDHGCILPVRFDDTTLSGLPETVFFFDARKKSPADIAQAVLLKLNKKAKVENIPKATFRMPKVKKNFNPYEEEEKLIQFLGAELKKRCEKLEQDISISIFNRNDAICIRIVFQGDVIYSFDITRGGIGSDKGLRFAYTRGELRSSGYNAFGEFLWDKDQDAVVLKFHGFGMFGNISGEHNYTQDEFVDLIWNEICEAIEEHFDRK